MLTAQIHSSVLTVSKAILVDSLRKHRLHLDTVLQQVGLAIQLLRCSSAEDSGFESLLEWSL